jgi:hypothetical protein
MVYLGFGTNEAGAEFGSTIPGVLGTDYTWPNTSAIQLLRDDGMNIFRVPFLMERILPNGLTSSPDATYLQDMTEVSSHFAPSFCYYFSPTPSSFLFKEHYSKTKPYRRSIISLKVVHMLLSIRTTMVASM